MTKQVLADSSGLVWSLVGMRLDGVDLLRKSVNGMQLGIVCTFQPTSHVVHCHSALSL